MSREIFITELDELQQEIYALGRHIESTFKKVVQAMNKGEKAVLQDLIEADEEVNEVELKINEQATLMITKQQPVASDLRHIIVCLKISSDLERMGDLSVDMAKAYLHMPSNQAYQAYRPELDAMVSKVEIMVRQVMEAYDSKDMLKAQQLAAMDDDIDQAYGKLVKDLFRSEYSVDQTAQLAFIARYMERIGDYCTNISEWIIYEVNGKRFDLN
ncbi:phosphate signaling complex protein PhoU [Alkalicoccus daliensis]|uniref:Phosphate-specific transport system accessory protein PhoU n=1 Tax=Alkalicoccus daliensis TaxID=745820 RepID=A0A1H0CPM7_9BACI|nr:phosphate signaling complex protein PhoU [Alkalicoccus daliensis]SDN59783.1 phosphate transport system protein [Alkalicoccus daliensis]